MLDLYVFNGRWFYLDRVSKDLATARADCAAKNMTLATFQNVYDYEAVVALLSDSGANISSSYGPGVTVLFSTYI